MSKKKNAIAVEARVEFKQVFTFKRSENEVIDLMMDPDYFREKYRLTTDRFTVRQIDSGPDVFHIVSEELRGEGRDYPKMLKKLWGDEPLISKDETWYRKKRLGLLNMHFKFLPIKIRCSMQLVPVDDASCECYYSWTVDCSLPLIGCSVAEIVAKSIRGAMPYEVKITNDFLSKRLVGS